MLNQVLTNMASMTGLWILVAALTEALTEIVKNVLPDVVKDKVTYGTSIVIGIVLAIAFNLNPFGLNDYAAYVSMIAAGILASRGANYLNGLLKRIGVLTSENK